MADETNPWTERDGAWVHDTGIGVTVALWRTFDGWVADVGSGVHRRFSTSRSTPDDALRDIGVDLPPPVVKADQVEFAVGDWVTLDSMTTAMVVSAVGYVRVHGEGGPSDAMPSQVVGTTTRPDKPWAIALDPQPGDEVEVDGRRWTYGRRRRWEYGHYVVMEDRRLATMLREVDDVDTDVIADLPDTLVGLDCLRVAGRILGCDLSDLPDGVEVTPEWRWKCGEARTSVLAEVPATVPAIPLNPDDEALVEEYLGTQERPSEPLDDRPVMAWWSADVRDEHGHPCSRCYRDPHSGEHYVMADDEPRPAAIADALGWRAVEVSGGSGGPSATDGTTTVQCAWFSEGAMYREADEATVDSHLGASDPRSSAPVDLSVMQAPGGWLVRPIEGGAWTYVPDEGWTWSAWQGALEVSDE